MDPQGNATSSITVPANASSDSPATSITDWNTYSEYGQATTGGATGPGTTAGTLGYGWLGGAQRATTPDTAGLTLMGARVYNNQRGLFTSTDPVYGGNENTYGYPEDPINHSDITGLMYGPGGGPRYHPSRYQYGRGGHAPYVNRCNWLCKRQHKYAPWARGLERSSSVVGYLWFIPGGTWISDALAVAAAGIRLYMHQTRAAIGDVVAAGVGHVYGGHITGLGPIIRKARRNLGKVRYALSRVGLGSLWTAFNYGLYQMGNNF